MSQFRDNASSFEQAGAQLIGIAVDSPFSHAAFAEKLQLNFPLLSDFNREVAPQYTGYWASFAMGLKGVGSRAVFVVDRSGIVRYQWMAPEPGVLPDVPDVLAAVQAIASS